jgi:hypothetical protein
MLTIVCLTTADTLTGRTVFIETLDLRSDTEIFNKRAKKNSSTLPACSALSLEMPDNQQKVLGAYELPMLFRNGIEAAIAKTGCRGSRRTFAGSVPVFQITINQFQHQFDRPKMDGGHQL